MEEHSSANEDGIKTYSTDWEIQVLCLNYPGAIEREPTEDEDSFFSWQVGLHEFMSECRSPSQVFVSVSLCPWERNPGMDGFSCGGPYG